MDQEQREKRKRIMWRSMALGHCVCDPNKPCPCPVFKEHDVCECAGERLPLTIDSADVKLTDYVRAAGCASKIGKKDLRDVLAGLPLIDDSRVLVGSSAGDDAGVVVLSEDEDKAMILTVDVFAPSVDDAYTFGQIAAANSLSDVYAMGGKPVAALSVIGFPIHSLPNEVMREILRGGVDKMAEAGISVVGGHSINDAEIKCGFAVIGTCGRDRFTRNAGAVVGDVLVLTKPLGVGIVAFAAQVGRAEDAMQQEIADSMSCLNKTASECMDNYDVHAVTDVTGYSLLGHLAEIVKNSEVEAQIDFDALPLFTGVTEFARQEILPGAVERNRESVGAELLDLEGLTEAQENIMFCPETSGGLLVCLPESHADDYVAALRAHGIETARIVGKVVGPAAGGRISAVTARAEEYGKLKVMPIPSKEDEMSDSQQQSCCEGDSEPESSCCGSNASSCCSGQEPEPASSCRGGEVTAGDNPSCCASADEINDASSVQAVSPSGVEAFQGYLGAVMGPGAIDAKNKKLMALALSVVTKCEPCVKINTKAARTAGATDQEIAEAVAMGIAFGGASTAMFYNTVRQNLR